MGEGEETQRAHPLGKGQEAISQMAVTAVGRFVTSLPSSCTCRTLSAQVLEKAQHSPEQAVALGTFLLAGRGFDEPPTGPPPAPLRSVLPPGKSGGRGPLFSASAQLPSEHLFWGVSQAPQAQILISRASSELILLQ